MPYPGKSRWGYIVPNDDRYRLKLTHFLCIPLATSKSRSQLSSARQRLMRDPVTSNIPTEAFVWPDTQKLVLGELSLPSDSTIATAKSLLRSLDHDSMLDELRSGNERRKNSGISRNLGDPHTVQPISVSINGFEHSEYLQGSARLDAPIIDTESILPGYFQGIRRRFLKPGLMKFIPGKPLDRNRPLRMAVMDSAHGCNGNQENLHNNCERETSSHETHA